MVDSNLKIQVWLPHSSTCSTRGNQTQITSSKNQANHRQRRSIWRLREFPNMQKNMTTNDLKEKDTSMLRMLLFNNSVLLFSFKEHNTKDSSDFSSTGKKTWISKCLCKWFNMDQGSKTSEPSQSDVYLLITITTETFIVSFCIDQVSSFSSHNWEVLKLKTSLALKVNVRVMGKTPG